MAARKAGSGKGSSRKSLAVRKRTVKDLTVQKDGPKGGFLMRDTIIIPTGQRLGGPNPRADAGR